MIGRVLRLITYPLALKLNQSVFASNLVTVTTIKPHFLHLNMLQLSTSTPTSGIKHDPVLTQEDNIIWVDLEMTGLDPDKDHILEAACLVTDSQLNIISEGLNLIVHQPDEVLQNMNEWSMRQHEESGLKKMCYESKLSLKEAEKLLLEYVRACTPFNKCALGGNTVYMDRFFLKKHMPEFEQHMHYRIIDVSSIKELCSRWYPKLYSGQPNKKELSKHRALEDIKASIDELKFYKEKIFRELER